MDTAHGQLRYAPSDLWHPDKCGRAAVAGEESAWNFPQKLCCCCFCAKKSKKKNFLTNLFFLNFVGKFCGSVGAVVVVSKESKKRYCFCCFCFESEQIIFGN